MFIFNVKSSVQVFHEKSTMGFNKKNKGRTGSNLFIKLMKVKMAEHQNQENQHRADEQAIFLFLCAQIKDWLMSVRYMRYPEYSYIIPQLCSLGDLFPIEHFYVPDEVFQAINHQQMDRYERKVIVGKRKLSSQIEEFLARREDLQTGFIGCLTWETYIMMEIQTVIMMIESRQSTSDFSSTSTNSPFMNWDDTDESY